MNMKGWMMDLLVFFYTEEQIENEQKDIRIRVGGYYAIQFQPDKTGADLILQNNNTHALTNFKWELIDEKTVNSNKKAQVYNLSFFYFFNCLLYNSKTTV